VNYVMHCSDPLSFLATGLGGGSLQWCTFVDIVLTVGICLGQDDPSPMEISHIQWLFSIDKKALSPDLKTGQLCTAKPAPAHPVGSSTASDANIPSSLPASLHPLTRAVSQIIHANLRVLKIVS
jgi:hypothetical protein